MAWWLRTLAALPDGQDLIPGTICNSTPGGFSVSFLSSTGTAHMYMCAHIYVEAKHLNVCIPESLSVSHVHADVCGFYKMV